MQEWRDHLCDRMEIRARNNPSYWLARGNCALEAVLMRQGRQQYQNFGTLIQAMRSNQWGYSDFIVEFLLDCQGEVYCFSHAGPVAHTLPREVKDVRQTYFIINESDDEGMCLVVCECVLLCADKCCVHLQGTLSILTLSLTRAGEHHFFRT